jgi:hypothetical protein
MPPTADDADYWGTNLAKSSYHWGRVDGGSITRTPAGRVSQGPWIIDTNHLEGALFAAPAIMWTNGESGGLPDSPNLVGATITIDCSFDDQHVPGQAEYKDDGRLVFWFQSRLPHNPPALDYMIAAKINGSYRPERVVNYFFSGTHSNFLPDAVANRGAVSISLSDNLNEWTCLGRNQFDVAFQLQTKGLDNKGFRERSALKYTCAVNQDEFRKALGAVNLAMGFLLVLPYTKYGGSGSYWLGGALQTPLMGASKLTLREFTIRR